MARQWRGGLALLGIGCLAVAGPACTDRPEPETLPLQPLEEALASELFAGWELVERPDLPGPYRRHPVPHIVTKGSGGARGWNNGRNKIEYEFKQRDDADQMGVPLETADGRLTVALLALPK